MNNLGKYIDHTLLKPQASRADILAVCEEAKRFHTASVCVNSCWAETVARALQDTDILTCVVIGFPLGAALTEVKAYETAVSIKKGAKEVDMVINVGFIKSGLWDDVRDDIAAVVEAANGLARVKVILETCLLTDDEKVRACEICKAVGVDFVKTSTGFSTGGATTADVELMRQTVGPDIGVKASGGIHTKEEAEAMIAAGASRIGASATRAIVEAE